MGRPAGVLLCVSGFRSAAFNSCASAVSVWNPCGFIWCMSSSSAVHACRDTGVIVLFASQAPHCSVSTCSCQRLWVIVCTRCVFHGVLLHIHVMLQQSNPSVLWCCCPGFLTVATLREHQHIVGLRGVQCGRILHQLCQVCRLLPS
jgi:hypothetical protein